MHLNYIVVSHIPEDSLLQEVSSVFFSRVGFLQGGGGGAVILCSVLCRIFCQSPLSSHSFRLQSRSSCRAALSLSDSLRCWITCKWEGNKKKIIYKVSFTKDIKLKLILQNFRCRKLQPLLPTLGLHIDCQNHPAPLGQIQAMEAPHGSDPGLPQTVGCDGRSGASVEWASGVRELWGLIQPLLTLPPLTCIPNGLP